MICIRAVPVDICRSKKVVDMKKLHLFLIMSLLGVSTLILPQQVVSEQESLPTNAEETETPTNVEEAPEKPLSVHQRASICWEDFDAVFDAEPFSCTVVCESCHLMEVPAIKNQTKNSKSARTHETYPMLLPDAGEEVNWNSVSLLQQACRNCHDEITENHENNHVIFIEYSGRSFSDFKETDLKLFDDYILCTTCHSPHQEHEALLRMSNAGSALCTNCHTR